ncbi:hypothetical protein B296_00002750 [Ensete ventricosum]|uniref:Uncharacterized protein n=1 Tax=Ensete ventricosum TaxID=4639 RepID=A0A427A0X7_ENSVE|nr:hypothetical protein B296_00002750 [Ensete ventricosum]
MHRRSTGEATRRTQEHIRGPATKTPRHVTGITLKPKRNGPYAFIIFSHRTVENASRVLEQITGKGRGRVGRREGTTAGGAVRLGGNRLFVGPDAGICVVVITAHPSHWSIPGRGKNRETGKRDMAAPPLAYLPRGFAGLGPAFASIALIARKHKSHAFTER